MSEPEEIQLNLKWDNFSSHLALSFDSCYESQRFVDVSLVCKNGEVIKGHKMILANTSRFFRRLLTENEHPHPMIVLHNIDADDLRSLMTFMYCGEVQVFQNDLKKLLEVADTLEITGLQQIKELDNPKSKFGVKNFAASNPDHDNIENAKNDKDCEMNLRSCNKPASNLLKYVSTLGQKNFDNSIQSFESSSKKLQQMAKKFEKGSNVGSWSFLQQIPNSSETRTKKLSNDNVSKTLQRLPENEPEGMLDLKSSGLNLQEMAKLLENINRHPTSSEVSKGTSDGQKRSLDLDENMETPAKKPNLNQSSPNTSEADHGADAGGPSAAQGTNADLDNEEQLLKNCSVFIKDELEVNSDRSATPDVELDNLQNDNLNVTNIGEHSGSSMLAAELLKAVANKRKDVKDKSESNSKSKKFASWDVNAMGEAMIAVEEKKMEVNRAAMKYSVPEIELQRYLRSPISPDVAVQLPSRFLADLEKQFIEYLLIMKRQSCSVVYSDVRKLVIQILGKNKLAYLFKNKRPEIQTWLTHLLELHGISIDTPCDTSVVGSESFDHVTIDRLFNILKTEYSETRVTPDRIFNAGILGYSALDSCTPEVVGFLGSRRIRYARLAERDCTFAVLSAISASGMYTPPMMIFGNPQFGDDFMKGAPRGALGRLNRTGWLTLQLFIEWFERFIEITKPSAASPVILIMNAHPMYNSIKVFDIVKANHVIMIAIPPRSSNVILPMEGIFMGPLKAYYNEELRSWVDRSKAFPCAHNLAAIFGKAYDRCQSSDLAAKNYETTGIYPLSQQLFTIAHLNYLQSRSRNSSKKSAPTNDDATASGTKENPGKNSDPNCTPVKVETSDSNLKKSDTNDDSSKPLIKYEGETPCESEIVCLHCNKKHSTDQSHEVWITCGSCRKWAHYVCAGVESENYICSFCK